MISYDVLPFNSPNKQFHFQLNSEFAYVKYQQLLK